MKDTTGFLKHPPSAPQPFKNTQHSSLANMSPDSVAMVRAAAHHPDVVQTMSEDQAEMARANIAASTKDTKKGAVKSAEALGDSVRRGLVMKHKPTQSKVTVIRASVDKKDGFVRHEVVDAKTGKKFLAKEKNLVRL